jgi:hypothetical protein
VKATSKRLLALVAGGLGLRAILRRRARPARGSSPAEELKARLATTKQPEPAQPAPPADSTAPAEVAEPAEAHAPESVDERRADTHARARHAIEELGENRE